MGISSKKNIEITLKCDTAADAANMLDIIAIQFRNAGFENAPSDLQELQSKDGRKMGLHYEVQPNDGTDIYGNDWE